MQLWATRRDRLREMSRRWRQLRLLFPLAGLLAGCAAQGLLPTEEAPVVTDVRRGDPSGAQAWVNDVDTIQGFIDTGRILYAADPVKKTAAEYCNEANLLTDRGEFRLALRAESEALYLSVQKNDFVLSAHCAAGTALAYDYAGDPYRAEFWAKEARSYLAKASPSSDEKRLAYIRTTTLKALGDAALETGQPQQATGYFTEALVAAKDYPEFRPWVLRIRRSRHSGRQSSQPIVR